MWDRYNGMDSEWLSLGAKVLATMLVVVTAGFGGFGFLSPRPNITSLTAEAMPISFCLAPKPS